MDEDDESSVYSDLTAGFIGSQLVQCEKEKETLKLKLSAIQKNSSCNIDDLEKSNRKLTKDLTFIQTEFKDVLNMKLEFNLLKEHIQILEEENKKMKTNIVNLNHENNEMKSHVCKLEEEGKNIKQNINKIEMEENSIKESMNKRIRRKTITYNNFAIRNHKIIDFK